MMARKKSNMKKILLGIVIFLLLLNTNIILVNTKAYASSQDFLDQLIDTINDSHLRRCTHALKDCLWDQSLIQLIFFGGIHDCVSGFWFCYWYLH